MVPVPAGSELNIDVSGLHYNRKSHPVQRVHTGSLQNVTQHGTGMTHILSNWKGSWANGIRTRLSHSLGAQGRALDVGNSPPSSSKLKSLTDRNLDFLR